MYRFRGDTYDDEANWLRAIAWAWVSACWTLGVIGINNSFEATDRELAANCLDNWDGADSPQQCDLERAFAGIRAEFTKTWGVADDE